MGVAELIEISRSYGSNPDYVLAGGGNTSWKNDRELYIKASGFPLATIEAGGLVRMDRSRLDSIWSEVYPAERKERESRALDDLMKARFPGEEAKRPSVETLLHECLDDAYVVHTHPALVNGLTCGAKGEERMRELFGSRVLWIPSVDPGYFLAKTVREMRETYIEEHGRSPEFILLENHGVFVSDEEPSEIDRVYRELFSTLESSSRRGPALDPIEGRERSAVSRAIESLFEARSGESVSVPFAANTELDHFLADAESWKPLSHPYTPDHIVYSGHRPLFFDGDPEDAQALAAAIDENAERAGQLPKVVAVSSHGIYGIGGNVARAETAVALFLDAVKIAVYAESHGGSRFLSDDLTAFVLDWEVEQFRSRIQA